MVHSHAHGHKAPKSTAMLAHFAKHDGYSGLSTYRCGQFNSTEHMKAACSNDVQCTGYSVLGGKPGCLAAGFGLGNHQCAPNTFYEKQ